MRIDRHRTRSIRIELVLLLLAATALTGCNSDPYRSCTSDPTGTPVGVQLLEPQHRPIRVPVRTTILVYVPVSADLGPLTSSNRQVVRQVVGEGTVEFFGPPSTQYRMVTRAPGQTTLSAAPVYSATSPTTRRHERATWTLDVTVTCDH